MGILQSNWVRSLTVFPNFICCFLMGLWGFEYLYGSSFNPDLWQWRVANGYDHALSVVLVLMLFCWCCLRFRKEPLFAVSAFGSALLAVGLGNMLADFLWVRDFTHVLTDTFIPELGCFLLLMSRLRYYAKNRLALLRLACWAAFVEWCMVGYSAIGAPLDFYVSPATHEVVKTAYWTNPFVGWWEIAMWDLNCLVMALALRVD